MVRGLLVSHAGERCGIYQYGWTLYKVLSRRADIKWRYRECSSFKELAKATARTNPDLIVFNYARSTLPWLDGDSLKKLRVPLFAIHHEFDREARVEPETTLFDFLLCPDPTFTPQDREILTVPRFIPPSPPQQPQPPEIFTVGSFGFATPTKGFEHLCRLVDAQFDKAVIRLTCLHTIGHMSSRRKWPRTSFTPVERL